MYKSFTLNSAIYPSLLRHIHKPPEKLFYTGLELDPNDVYLAIVGTRRPSIYGQQMTEKFATELAMMGFVIVSGLAYGIDAIAHEAALKHHPKKRTIAVLGSGLGNIAPICNRDLAKRISQTGTVLTEYEENLAPHKGMFPRRNRIIAGMAIGTLVIEAPEKSGALITARFALESGREVFSLPANLTQESSRGTNILIRDCRAAPVMCTQDILQALSAHLPTNMTNAASQESQQSLPLIQMTRDEQLIYTILRNSTTSRDDLIKRTNLDASQISSLLSMLELKGVITIQGTNISIAC